MSAVEQEIGRVLRAARLDAGWTQDALAAAIGCSKPQLSLMESGQRTLSPERARLIEAALGLADERLSRAVAWGRVPETVRAEMEETHDKRRRLAQELRRALEGETDLESLRAIVEQSASNVDSPLPLRRRIPVINNVAAGYPQEFTDLDYPASVADEYIACPDVADPDAFAARVVGDSMEPAYREGEIVVFSPQLATPTGSDCFVRLERDNETTFKRIYLEDEGALVRLQPLNPSYPPRTVRAKDIGGMYAAAYVMRKVGG